MCAVLVTCYSLCYHLYYPSDMCLAVCIQICHPLVIELVDSPTEVDKKVYGSKVFCRCNLHLCKNCNSEGYLFPPVSILDLSLWPLFQWVWPVTAALCFCCSSLMLQAPRKSVKEILLAHHVGKKCRKRKRKMDRALQMAKVTCHGPALRRCSSLEPCYGVTWTVVLLLNSVMDLYYVCLYGVSILQSLKCSGMLGQTCHAADDSRSLGRQIRLTAWLRLSCLVVIG